MRSKIVQGEEGPWEVPGWVSSNMLACIIGNCGCCAECNDVVLPSDAALDLGPENKQKFDLGRVVGKEILVGEFARCVILFSASLPPSLEPRLGQTRRAMTPVLLPAWVAGTK